jgi:8-oxo-dGTP diphosphatase
MTVTASDVAVLVEGVLPYDDMEADHRADASQWLRSASDVFRRSPPATPAKHLVAYFLLRDPADGSVYLVHHRRAGLWLPTGGHVEAGEDPADTVRREAPEELGVPARFASVEPRPLFVTVTDTVGDARARHTDVSLWYLLDGSRHEPLCPDEREFAAARWWSRAEVPAADPSTLEPHLRRFLAKLDAR